MRLTYLFLFIPLVFFSAVLGAHAAELNLNIPVDNPSTNPAGIVANFYEFALAIGGLLAFGAIIFGAIKWTVSAGNPSQISDAKQWITDALLGLLLLVGAYLILNVINPCLTDLRLPKLEQIAKNPALEDLENIPKEKCP